MPHQNDVVANVTDIRIRRQCRFHSMSEPGAQDLQLCALPQCQSSDFPERTRLSEQLFVHNYNSHMSI